MQIPQAHGARVSETIWVGIRYINPILSLTYEHDSVDVHLLGVGSLGSLCRLLEIGAHLLVELGGVAALESEGLAVGCHAEDALPDD